VTAAATPSTTFAASASGLFAYTNSNNDDDATLKIIVPAGKGE
jgi:hypothetical protein